MKQSFLITLLFSIAFVQLSAQMMEGDTTIYPVAEESPRFPGCEQLDTTITFKAQCAQASLLNFMYSNIQYPLAARQENIEGTVVTSFVVEKDSTISNIELVKDIGGGCGEAVLRVVNAMNEVGVRWVPGKMNGRPVRTQFNLPIRFRLEEAPPYTMVGRDTVYTEFDTPLAFKGGDEALIEYVDENLKYPAQGNDSCSIGYMDVQILVEPDGFVKVLDILDYNDLGVDFQFNAITTATNTTNMWEPATFEGRKVPTAFDIRMGFIPTAEQQCAEKIERFEKANTLANEGTQLYNSGETEAGLAKLTEAIALFPNNADFLYSRGQAYLDLKQFPEACADLSMVKQILSVNWYDNLLPIICSGNLGDEEAAAEDTNNE